MSPDPSRDRQVSRKSARPPSHDDTDQDEHYLTAAYGGHGAPIVVAVVGLSATGKTELIRAMFDQLSRGWALSAHGLSVDWIGSRHGNTGATAAPNADVTPWPEYAETVLLRRHDQAAWPLIFLEIAEADVCSLETPDNGRRPSSVRAGRALLHADAFMFVHEPQLLEATAATVSACNSAVTQALAYRKARDADPSRPSVIVMTKADGLRYVPPIDGWLRRRSGGPLDLQAIWSESCDVFAYLHHAGASESLAPYREFARCTLHAASAGGRTEARPAPTPAPPLGRGAMRVIEPLVAVLAMVGVIDSPDATLVGRPCEGCALRSPIRIHMIVESEGGLNPLSQEFLLVDDLMDLAYAASARKGGPRWSP